MYPKFIRTFSIDPTFPSLSTSPIPSPSHNSSLLSTMYQLKQGNTLTPNSKNISQLSFRNHLPDSPKILQINNNINFQLTSHPTCRSKQKRPTVSFLTDQNTSKISNRREQISAPSYTENSQDQIGVDSQIEQSKISTATERVLQLSFRNKGKRRIEDRLEKENSVFKFRSQSPQTGGLSKQSSGHFMPQKNPRMSDKKIKERNTFDSAMKIRQLEKQLSQTNQDILFLNRERSENLRLIAELNSQVNRLTKQNKSIKFQSKTKQTIFFQQISQLLKDRKILQTKLSNLQLTTSTSQFPNSQFLQNITLKLNQKDTRIRELQSLSHDYNMKIDLLTFEVENLRARTHILNMESVDEEQVIFEEAYRHLELEVQKYRKRIGEKDQEIGKVKERLREVVEEREGMGKELEVLRGDIRGEIKSQVKNEVRRRSMEKIDSASIMSVQRGVMSPCFGGMEMNVTLEIVGKEG